jgi:hypothetical protein
MEAADWHVSGLTVGQVAERMSIAPSAVDNIPDAAVTS